MIPLANWLQQRKHLKRWRAERLANERIKDVEHWHDKAHPLDRQERAMRWVYDQWHK